MSQIRDDGYLRVHRIGRGSRHPLWDQAFEAQQIRVLTSDGPVAGVVARSNGHFAQQHRNETGVVGADDLWVDVGATSAEDVSQLGIRLLDPLARHLPPWVLAGEVAGPDAGRRVGCAGVATLARAAQAGSAPTGETLFVLSAQEGFGWVGLSSLIARGGEFDSMILLAPGQGSGVTERRPSGSLGRLGPALTAAGVETVTWVAPMVRSAGSHMEGITAKEAEAVLWAGARAAGMSLGPDPNWVEALIRAALRTDHVDASLQPPADLLQELVELHGVPGHEWAVRRHVLESLPGWARDRAVVDDIGNIMVEAGPEGDSTVFMAHIDEVGYEVESIAADGVVTLASQGGAVSSAWEGQTALLHFDPDDAPSTQTGNGTDTDSQWKRQSLSANAPSPLRGIFLTRDAATRKNPGTLRAWFGLDALALNARGVRRGLAVTSHKEGLRMGITRFVARSLDDRAGTTAMLLAVNELDPDALPSKVIFAWSVHEEGGLVGAGAMARRFGSTARRIGYALGEPALRLRATGGRSCAPGDRELERISKPGAFLARSVQSFPGRGAGPTRSCQPQRAPPRPRVRRGVTRRSVPWGSRMVVCCPLKLGGHHEGSDVCRAWIGRHVDAGMRCVRAGTGRRRRSAPAPVCRDGRGPLRPGRRYPVHLRHGQSGGHRRHSR